MEQCTTVVGWDVHKKTLVNAVLPHGAERVTERRTIENPPRAIAQRVTRIAARGPVVCVDEAGPCADDVQRQRAALGHRCAVMAPSLTPRRPGDRVNPVTPRPKGRGFSKELPFITAHSSPA